MTLAGVKDIRGRIARAHARAAAEFRDAFIPGQTPPTRHLELLAAALIDEARGVRLRGPAYSIDGNVVTPLYANFDVDPSALFEYWMIASEIAGAPSWRMTRVIASAEEYDGALRIMRSPQIVRALVGSFLPTVDHRALEVTVYTRADEERIERRLLVLGEDNEFDFHGRELIAEGRGGVPV